MKTSIMICMGSIFIICGCKNINPDISKAYDKAYMIDVLVCRIDDVVAVIGYNSD